MLGLPYRVQGIHFKLSFIPTHSFFCAMTPFLSAHTHTHTQVLHESALSGVFDLAFFVDLLRHLQKYNVVDVANYLNESVCKPACCVYLHCIAFGFFSPPLTCQLLRGLSYCVIEST